MRRARSLALGLSGFFVLAGALPGCSKETQVQPSDTLSAAQLQEIEKKVSSLIAERDGAKLAAGIADSEAGVLRKNVTELQDRLRALETQLAQVSANAAKGAGAPADSGSGAGPAVAPGLPVPQNPEAAFTEEQVAAFRKLSDEVQKRRDAEAAADRVRRELSRAGVALSPEQEATVIRLQSQYADKMRDLFKGGFGGTEADRQAMTEKRDALRTGFETDLRAQIPAAEADKIVEAMKRGWPGFFPRRTDGRPGMGGNGGASDGMTR